ncbi:L-asparaginase [Desulfacinum hydrothermale DSM 13146]|uniref:L-asparaginase n=1 Tax=Desulfacinum hydrothermale DSM 13146 TaxID=1121390 RepID=A0A1W1XVY9_9BACT|nr:asparaginase domain-containing protein [Desulfacinum hydrothermale]SMC28022.1 L-asparaginase [Desulfacinum hydrothermale DSM 13146]
MEKIFIFTTGGTIDKVYFDQKSRYEVGEPQVEVILREANVTAAYEIRPLMRKDSLDLTDADRALVRRAVEECPSGRIIITHGTDTMKETAQVLQGMPGKVIVLTGAIEPARIKSSDAPFNVGAAMAAVQTLPPGVYIAMNGRIFDPRRVRKNREANRFEEVEPHPPVL